MTITVEMRTEVTQDYVALFGRAPDSEGLAYWVQQLGAGVSSAEVAQQMFDTEPARAYYPGYYTNEEIVASFYMNVLGREADADGLAYWAGKLDASTPGVVVREMIDAIVGWAPTGEATDDDAQMSQDLFNNKVAVGEYWGVNVGTIDGSTEALDGVTADSDVSSDAAIEEIIGGAVPGETFTLTTGIDLGEAFTGTAGNDTFVGIIGDASATLTIADDINGGEGSDTLSLIATGTAANTSLASVTNIGLVNIQDASLTGAVFDASVLKTTATITVSNLSTQATTVKAGGLDHTYGLKGAGDLTVDFATTSGTADNAKVAVSGVGSKSAYSTVDVADGNTIEAVTLATTGTNYVNLAAGSKAATITVQGDGTNNLTLASAASSVTFDATAATGNNTFELGAELSSADTIKGGAGNDVLTAQLNAATLLKPTITGFETITLDVNAAATFNMANVEGATKLSLDLGANGTVNQAGSELSSVAVIAGAADVTLEVTRPTGETGELTLTVGGKENIDLGAVELTGNTSVTITNAGAKDNDLDDVQLDGKVETLNLTTTEDGILTMGDIDAENDTTKASVLSELNITAGVDSILSAGYIYAGSGDGSAGSGGVEASLTITAADGADIDINGFSGWQLSSVTVTVGEDASANLGYIDVSGGNLSAGFADESDAAFIGMIDVTAASGAYVSAGFSASAQIYTDIGDVTLTGASGSEIDISAYASAGNIGNINITTDDGRVSAFFSASAFSGGSAPGDLSGAVADAFGGGGDIGDIVLTVTDGSAYIDLETDADTAAGGSIGSITVTVTGTDASAYVSAASDGSGSANLGTVGEEFAGNIGAISLTVNGDHASGEVYADANSGNIADVTVSADGNSGSAYISLYASDYESAGISGDIGTITGSVGDDADLDIFADASGHLGAVSLTAGDDAYVYFSGYGYYDGDDGVTVTLGENSSAGIKLGNTGAEAVTGDITLTAGIDADVDVYMYGGSSGGGSVTLIGGSGGDAMVGGETAGTISDVDLSAWQGTSTVDLHSVALGTTITTGGKVDNITGTQGADVIIAGGGNDVIKGGTGVDDMTGGAGTDKFVFTDVDTDADTAAASAAVTDVINDFVTKSDSLDFDTAGVVGNYVENTTAEASWAALTTAADTALNGTVKYYFGVYNGDGYLFFDNDGTGFTSVIQMVGVTDMEFGDIV